MEFRLGDLDAPDVEPFLREHVEQLRAVTPPGSSHALDLAGLRGADVRFWTARGDAEHPPPGALLGTVALKRIEAGHVELKSMRTAPARRRSGLGAALLGFAVERAREDRCHRISLETGSFKFFAPARALYRAHGFVECPPFADYTEDPNSTFLTLRL